MEPNQVALIIGIVVLVLAGAVWFYFRQQRSSNLRARFGPEYERLVRETGSQRSAEGVLEKREKRVQRLAIRRLAENDRDRFMERWREAQARFVDDPRTALEDADELVEEVLKARGYPVSDFEQRAADVSVDHPRVILNYRTAHDLVTRDGADKPSTEELRHALVLYRELFEELLEINEPMVAEEKHESTFRR
jgi:hypothetical protein